jgi:predicted ATPase/DNA-binding CsgD family transcriptional regulator
MHPLPDSGTNGTAKRDGLSPTNLPLPESSFVGRSLELQELRELATRHRLLTVVGLGGIGKTRLALQFARDSRCDYADGVWYVSLKELDDANRVAEAVAYALGAHAPAGSTEAQLVAHLRDARALVVLDNAEHLLSAVAPLAHRLLRSASGLCLLVTSREPLQIEDEHVFVLHGIDEATRLFVERAYPRHVERPLALPTRTAIASICTRLQAIPLAIELAAARAQSIPPEDLMDEIEAFSATSPVLGQTLAWSYRLLSDSEQQAFAALSLFEGSFTWEAAEAVSAPGEQRAVAILTSLVKKSLVATQRVDSGVDYYLLDVVREYARDCLRESGRSPVCTRRYVDYHLASMERAANDPDSAKQLARSWHNAQGALRLAIDERIDVARAPTVAAGLYGFWSATGRANEGLDWLQRAAACRALSPPEQLQMLDASARLASRANRLLELEPLAEQLVREREPEKEAQPKAYGDALFLLGNAKALLGDVDEAEALYNRALLQYETSGDRRSTAMLKGTLGVTIAQQAATLDRLEHGKTLCLESLQMFREGRLRVEEAQALENLGVVHTFLGELPEALSVLQKAVSLYREIGDPAGAAIARQNVACVYVAMNRPVQALSELLAGRRLMTEIPRGPFCACYAETAFNAAVDLGAYNAAAQFYAFAEAWRRLICIPCSPTERLAMDSRYLLLAKSIAPPILEQLLRDGAALRLAEVDALLERTIAVAMQSELESNIDRAPASVEGGANTATMARRRLSLRLDQALTFPVVFLAAGAAWGKTTAIEQYLRETKLAAVWLVLDPDTLGVEQFVHDVRNAIEAQLDSVTLPLPGPSVTSAASQIVDWLAAYSGTIVVDDVHLAASQPAIARLLFEVISRTKDTIRWFILSRDREQDPLGSCLAYGLTGQPLDERDLAFTFDEAMDYARAQGAAVTPDEMHAILAFTEGWPRGVAVALEELIAIDSHFPQRIERVRSKTISRLALFVRETLYAGLGPDDRRLLLMAAAMPGDLRIDVIRQLDVTVQQRLQELVTKRALQPIGESGYRLTPMLRHVAASELEKSPEKSDIARALADAYERLGDAVSAIRVSLQVEAYDSVLRLLEEHTYAWANGEWPDLLNDVALRLPGHFLRSNTIALLVHATVLARHSRVEDALRLIEDARTGGDATEALYLACAHAALRLNHGRPLRSAAILAALETSAGDDLQLRARALLCCAYLDEGQSELARSGLSEISNALQALVLNERTIDIAHWAALASYRLHEYAFARQLAQRITTAFGREPWLTVAQAHALLALIASQSAAAFDDLNTHISDALNTASRFSDRGYYRAYLDRRCSFLFYNGSIDLIDLAKNHPDTMRTPLWVTYSTVFRFLTDIESARRENSVEGATRVYAKALQAARALALDPVLTVDDPFIASSALIMTGSLAGDIAIKGAIGQALVTAEEHLAHLEGVQPSTKRHAMVARLVGILCNFLLGERPPIAQLRPILEAETSDAIVRAVANIVGPTMNAGYTKRETKRATPDIPEDAREAFGGALADLRTRGYGVIATLLEALAKRAAMVAASGVALTGKETDVLKLMALGYSAADISTELIIALNTVTTHQKNIFRKLGVTDKVAAINEGRALGVVR